MVLTHNRCKMLERCLGSLERSNYKDTELIVVDDCSTDGTAALVKQKFPTAKYLRHPEPLLTAVGINEGISASTGSIVVIIDDDNIVDSSMVGELVRAFNYDPEVAVAGPLCYYLDDPKRVMYAGAKLTPFTRRVKFIASREVDYGQFQGYPEVDVFPNCFAVRKSIILKTGLADTARIPFFNDDASIQYLAVRSGYKATLVPRAKTWHDYPSRQRDERTLASRLRLYYVVRSKIMFERICDTPRGRFFFAISFPGYFLGYLLSVLTSPAIASQKATAVQTIIEATIDGLLDKGGRKYVE